MKIYLFAGSLFAERKGVKKVFSATVSANSESHALGFLYERIHKVCPADEGWHSHFVNATQFTEEEVNRAATITNIGIANFY